MSLKWIAALFASAALLLPAAVAETPRACSKEELAAARPAPMPRDFESIVRFRSRTPRLVGLLIDVDAAGRPTVRCSIASISWEPKIAEAVDAVSGFTMWPEDATSPDAPLYIHLQTGMTHGSLPSVLPRANAPSCDTMTVEQDHNLKPIYRPKPIYPRGGKARDKVEVIVVVDIEPTGAVRLNCLAAGENTDGFAHAVYYYAAQLRFAAERGRKLHRYSLTARYLQR